MKQTDAHQVWLLAAGLIALVLALFPDCALGQSAGGSLMRQISALDGTVPDATPWESLMMPDSIFDRRTSLAGYNAPEEIGPGILSPQEGASAKPQWSSPYEMSNMSMSNEEENTFFVDLLPEGCLPWGPRTRRDHRHLGIFSPLEGTSWMNRPYSAGWGAGVLWGDDPLDNLIDFEPGFYGIYRVGWDYDYYWGLEARIGQATLGSRDNIVGTPEGTADVTLFDTSLLWYPTGDSRWRPYFCVGLGFQHFNFHDHNFQVVNTSAFSMPIGIGIKWMYTPWIVLRLELTENLAFGNDEIDMMHNGALTAGMEVRFGGPRPSYWPWNPNRKIW
jgi:hypothetical protein